MGAINFSFDPKLMEFLAHELPLKIFVETGTFKGDSLRKAMLLFKECHSVELSPEYHAAALKNFEGSDGVHLHHGESPAWLRGKRNGSPQRPLFSGWMLIGAWRKTPPGKAHKVRFLANWRPSALCIPKA